MLLRRGEGTAAAASSHSAKEKKALGREGGRGAVAAAEGGDDVRRFDKLPCGMLLLPRCEKEGGDSDQKKCLNGCLVGCCLHPPSGFPLTNTKRRSAGPCHTRPQRLWWCMEKEEENMLAFWLAVTMECLSSTLWKPKTDFHPSPLPLSSPRISLRLVPEIWSRGSFMKWGERELIPPAFLFLQASQQDFIQSPAEPFDAAMLYRGERGQRKGGQSLRPTLRGAERREKFFSLSPREIVTSACFGPKFPE